MYISGLAEYLPDQVVDNQYFSDHTGRPPEWFQARTGMLERRRAASGENANTMAVDAVTRLAQDVPAALESIDLILGCSYTPSDTIATMAHAVQRQFKLHDARALYISSACSSFLNGLEMAAAYFDSGRSKRALVVASEHNSLYANDDDPQSGHLWGDGAAAALVTRDALPSSFLDVLDVTTAGLGHLGEGPGGVYLAPRGDGLVVPKGRDVFQHACREMEAVGRGLLEKHGVGLDQLRLLVAHQANRRIIEHVADKMGLPTERVAYTVETLGNTGCASAPISLARYRHLLKSGDIVLMVAFGGGYSSGGALFRVR